MSDFANVSSTGSSTSGGAGTWTTGTWTWTGTWAISVSVAGALSATRFCLRCLESVYSSKNALSLPEEVTQYPENEDALSRQRGLGSYSQQRHYTL